MPALRSTIFYLAVLVGTLVGGAFLPLAVCLPRHWCYRQMVLWNAWFLWSARVFCGVRVRVDGAENLPESGPYMVMAKHQASYETFLLITLLPQPVFVLRRSLLRIPMIGWGIALTRPIAVDHKSPVRSLKDLVRQARERFARGAVVVIFPEGTRTPVGEHPPYQIGGAHVAVQNRVPVIPMVHNAGHVWPRGYVKQPGVVTVRFGPAFETGEVKPAQLNAQVREWIVAAGAELSPPI